jgi:hypothetical protein
VHNGPYLVVCQLAKVMGALVTIWGTAVLVSVGPNNLSKRHAKQEAPDLPAPGAAH